MISVPSRFDEPRGHPAPEREAPGSRVQLPESSAVQAGRCHHPVQPAQVMEDHGETGPEDGQPMSSLGGIRNLEFSSLSATRMDMQAYLMLRISRP